jgi:hypothetical protein
MAPKLNETHLEDVSLTRIGADSVSISWTDNNQDSKVAIFKGEKLDF